MQQHNIACASVQDRGWGLLTQLTLPGGGKLGVYQPRHARPKPMGGNGTAKKPVRRPAKRVAKPSARRHPKKKVRSR
jgi:hypothetical protein